VQDKPAQVTSVSAQGKEPVIEPIRGLNTSVSFLEVILEDDHERMLL